MYARLTTYCVLVVAYYDDQYKLSIYSEPVVAYYLLLLCTHKYFCKANLNLINNWFDYLELYYRTNPRCGKHGVGVIFSSMESESELFSH